ncbi:unnamed protein product [Cylindrotheca closterium]|uniref:Uncharacterized protein n=1 Tax=Cylindrotheca closterium TaxID=2856 RepID=A0AAD2CL46_9STRA|nr:unnamed protein product [Cylindrotheca closterium]
MNLSMELEDGNGDWDCYSDCDSDSEYSYETINTNDSGDFSSDGLSTIVEETEKDLMSKCSHDIDASFRSDLDSPIQMPRATISLGAFLERDERRYQSNNLDVTAHEINNLDLNSESESLKVEEVFFQKSVNSFFTQDDDAKSFNSSSPSFFQKSANSLNVQEIFQRSTSSFATQGSDAKSVDSSSTTGSFRLAQLKLKKSLSLRKLKTAYEAADFTSSFRKDDENASKCISSMEQTLLKSPASARSSKGQLAAKKNLLNAISVLTISQE